MTVNVHEAVLPEVSIAVHVTEVVPTGKIDPEAGLQTTVTPGQLSVALKSPEVRNRVTKTLFERAKKLSPAPFFVPEAAGLIRIGNVEDNLPEIKDADWVIEAVLEKMELKKDLTHL